MKIALLGTGNVATVLGRKFKTAGHEIIHVYGRDMKKASDLAAELDAESCNYLTVLKKDADLYLVSLSDDALAELTHTLELGDRLVAHTAGAVSIHALDKVSTRFGVFYPLQSLRAELPELPHIPMMVEGNTPAVQESLKQIALTISNQVEEGNGEKRLKLHLAAVFCNNFTNHLYHLAAGYCQQEGLDFNLLQPLIIETALRLRHISPAGAQTGPAIRNDQATIQKHLSLMQQNPGMKEVYELMTKSIRE